MAERLVKQLRYTIVTTKSAKQQAQIVMKLLKDHPEVPYERVPMVVTVAVAPADEERVFAEIDGLVRERRELPGDDAARRYEVVVDPSAWRLLEQLTGDVASLQIALVSMQQEDD